MSSHSTSLPSITDDTFAEALGAGGALLVDYWAQWCSPCLQLEPVLAEIAELRADQLRIVKLDTAMEQRTPIEQQVLRLPTLQLFVDGVEVARLQGAVPRARVVDLLDAHL